MEDERESVRVSKDLLVKLREIAKRDGMLLGPLIDRMIVAGMKAEKIK